MEILQFDPSTAEVGPGYVLVELLDPQCVEETTASGLAVIRTEKSKFDRAAYGRVIRCGPYQSQAGQVLSLADLKAGGINWPIPEGTILGAAQYAVLEVTSKLALFKTSNAAVIGGFKILEKKK